MRRALVLLACFSALGCQQQVASVTGGKVTAPVLSFPTQILGLAISQENVVGDLKGVDRPYVDSVAVFSFREENLLRATLQVSRFNRLARPGSAAFRASVVGLLGASQPLRMQVDDTDVWTTTGNKQNVFIWFEGRGFFVLSVHQEYEFPRTLLRRVITMEVSL